MQNSGGAGSKPAYKRDRGFRDSAGASGVRRPSNSGDKRISTGTGGGSRRFGSGPTSTSKNYSKDDSSRFRSPSDRRPRPGAVRGRPVVKAPPPVKIVSDMQITDGKLHGKFLLSTLSPRVRPTQRQVRETMFKLIFRRIRGGRVLDLCAGSGMVGLEAISRGACLATFVESSAKMCSFIKKNMESCGVKMGHGEIVNIEVIPFLKRMEKRKRVWDVVYFDPPYDSNYDEVLELFSRGVAIKQKGLLVIEHHAEMFFPEQLGALKRLRVVPVGETALSFYERV